MPKFQHTEQFQYLNTLTWLRGRHQVKFGADVMVPMSNEYFDVAPTRGNLRSTASSPATRLPTSCSAMRSARS